jgi:transcriptional regulator with XRE-family HTH domain
MAKRGDPGVLRLLVIFLRSQANRTQAEFGKESRVDQAQVSRYELGELAPSEEALRRMAKAAGIDWPLVVHLRQFYSALLEAARRSAIPAAREIPEPVLLAMAPYLIELHNAKPTRPSPEDERREAEPIWTALEKYPVRFRRRLIELSPRSGSWALAVRACEASVESAAHEAGEALELAELALSIAERAPGEESWRSRLKGYCWAHVAKARRAANDPAGAEEALAQARELWQAGGDAGLPAVGVLPSLPYPRS